MLNLLKLFKSEYHPLNIIEISKNNLISNYKYLSSKIKIAPVLKSNAYGHGIVEIAKDLDQVNAPFFCVDSLYEAYQLLKTKIKTPILIMGYTDPENFKVKKLPFSYAVFDLELAKILNKYQKGCGVHIFVDTGMHREGVPLSELPEFLEEIKRLTNIKVEGLMSHIASADNPKDPLNKIQVKNFEKALSLCKRNGIKPKWIHLQNSDGLINLKNVNLNIARVGLALYGISPDIKLKPALTLKSKIIQIKTLEKGGRVGYSGTFTSKTQTKVAILPLGYNDGLDRRLSSNGFVKIGETFCPIIGRISMNITTIDITKIKNPLVGQEVIIYSNNPADKNSIQNSAKICNTIPYDLLVGLTGSTRRVII